MKKRIALLGTRGIPARYGGFETFAEELAVRLVTLGFDVTVYCERSGSSAPGMYKGVRLVYLSVPSLGPLTTILFDLRCLIHSCRTHDLIYMLGYGAAPFCIIPRLWGRRVWINVDGIEWARAKWSLPAKVYFKCMEFCAMRAPHRVIADAEGIRGHLESRHARIPPCSVIPYGAEIVTDAPDETLLAAWGLEPRGYYLVVARLEPENHISEIIEGYIQSRSSLPLIVAGNHETGTAYANSLVARANSNIRFIGGIYDKQALQALRFHAVAYFHGHSVGGTNPSLLEALGCGNMIIAHDNIFNREVVGEVGLYFSSSSDIPELVGVMERMTDGDVARRASGAHDRIRIIYNWDSVTSRYVNLINDDIGLP